MSSWRKPSTVPGRKPPQASQRKAVRAPRAEPFPSRMRYLPIPGTQRRLRSRYVALGAIGAAVLGLCSCTAFEDKHCVDRQTTQVIDETHCRNGSGFGRWYYGGTSRSGRMTGGSYSRGGFGRVFGTSHGG